MYLTTKSGKRMIDHNTHLPLFNRSVDFRIKTLCNQLYSGMNKKDIAWERIKAQVKVLGI